MKINSINKSANQLGLIPDGVRRVRQWLIAVAAGLVAILALGVAQWYFAEFLLSEGARNFFFAADQWDYNSSPGSWQYEFWGDPMTVVVGWWTAVIATASATVGLFWGNWMRRVRR